jgi:putative phosphoesterase
MKIAVLSDTHAHSIEEIAPQVINALEDADLIVHAGDFVGLGLYEDLKKLGEVKAVRGNMDQREIRAVLPEQETFTIEGKKIGVMHGWGGPAGLEDKIRERFSDVDIIIYGHTHRAKNEFIGDVYFFNPGSARNSYGILEIDETIKGRILKINP